MNELENVTGVEIGIIGGSGLYSLEGLTVLGEYNPTTPWGKPSDPLVIAEAAGVKVAFLARHGRGHQYNPSEVPSRANIAALKSIGTKVILAFSAVGSLREEIEPRHFVLPSQIIDRTKGIRPHTFFSNGVVGHVMFGDPFCNDVADLIYKTHKKIGGPQMHRDKTIVCMEGPQFSTRAESLMYRQWGGDIINMSALPESKLAREAEIAYQMICMSTDYDCWRKSETPVTVEEVMSTMKDNSIYAKKLAAELIPAVHEAIKKEKLQSLKQLQGASQFAVMTSAEKRNDRTFSDIKYLLPSLK